MPYNQILTQRIHRILERRSTLVEKRMFGGIGFLLHGNMVCGVQGDILIVRVGSVNHASALAQPYTHPFLGAGRKPIKGWITISPEGYLTDGDLQRWITLAYEYVLTLPEK